MADDFDIEDELNRELAALDEDSSIFTAQNDTEAWFEERRGQRERKVSFQNFVLDYLFFLTVSLPHHAPAPTPQPPAQRPPPVTPPPPRTTRPRPPALA